MFNWLSAFCKLFATKCKQAKKENTRRIKSAQPSTKIGERGSQYLQHLFDVAYTIPVDFKTRKDAFDALNLLKEIQSGIVSKLHLTERNPEQPLS
ncbi:MAG: hypothetical protein J0L56_05865 [Chitinophagales bacterium]|nr:hypothetical protein [Chitinophagales bacterium]